MDGRMDNVKTVYPPTNTVCGGYKHILKLLDLNLKPGPHSPTLALNFNVWYIRDMN